MSDSDVTRKIRGLVYDYIIYFVDMKSLRSWRIVNKAISSFSSYFTFSNQYMVVNNSRICFDYEMKVKQTGVHAFALSRITEVTEPHGIPLLAFSDMVGIMLWYDVKDERLQADVCYSLIHQILGQRPSSIMSVLHDNSRASVAAYVL